MSDIQSRCLDAFPLWLRSLADDARGVAAALEAGVITNETARRQLAGALNYLFKSLDLIPDGIEDLGFIDDAFVFRVAAAAALGFEPGAQGNPASASLERLAADAELIREFLGPDAARLERYAAALGHGTVRGRSVDEIVNNPQVAAELFGEVRAWASGYSAPAFSRDDKNLVKLKAFLAAKLPA
jgi:uncharacterized membrane protein YkvA (DUF1232 family)